MVRRRRANPQHHRSGHKRHLHSPLQMSHRRGGAEPGRQATASRAHASMPPVDVVAVIGAREAARVRRPVGVPAVDQLGRAQLALDRGELAHELRAGAACGRRGRSRRRRRRCPSRGRPRGWCPGSGRTRSAVITTEWRRPIAASVVDQPRVDAAGEQIGALHRREHDPQVGQQLAHRRRIEHEPGARPAARRGTRRPWRAPAATYQSAWL